MPKNPYSKEFKELPYWYYTIFNTLTFPNGTRYKCKIPVTLYEIIVNA